MDPADQTKACPRCAETIKFNAVVCRFCGYDYQSPTPGFTKSAAPAPAARKTLGCGSALLIIIFALIMFSALLPSDKSARPVAPVISQLDAKTIQGCETALKTGERSGLIRKRPKATRLDVEDVAWRLSSADDKRALLALLSCSAFGLRADDLSKDLGSDQFVVVYGYRSGRRLAMLTGYGANFEE
jgi:hypothetical protein